MILLPTRPRYYIFQNMSRLLLRKWSGKTPQRVCNACYWWIGRSSHWLNMFELPSSSIKALGISRSSLQMWNMVLVWRCWMTVRLVWPPAQVLASNSAKCSKHADPWMLRDRIVVLWGAKAATKCKMHWGGFLLLRAASFVLGQGPQDHI